MIYKYKISKLYVLQFLLIIEKKYLVCFLLSILLLPIVYCDSQSNFLANNIESCPNKCICLGDYIDCGKRNITLVPVLPYWVKNLDLSNNKLNAENIQVSVRNLTKLTELNIENNYLDKIPLFVGLQSIRSISLANNIIETIDIKSLENLSNLKSLDLNKNKITIVLQNSFPGRNRLLKLYLNENEISIIDELAFRNLTQLQELRLNLNRITAIPKSSLIFLTNLKKLDSSNNEIYEINSLSFENQNKLKALKLKNNKIEKIHNDAFYGATTLINLDLSFNELTSIESHYFKGLNNLEELILEGNKISYIRDSAFNSTPSLQKLVLSNNKITLTEDLKPKFIALKQLIKLSLNSNQMKTIKQNTFSGLNNLQLLDLNNNNLTSVQAEGFHHFTSLTSFKINSINLICDCNMGRFYNWLRSVNRNFFDITALCEYPNWLNGKSLKTLTVANFTCYELLKPKIVEEPKGQVVIRGSNMTLTCIATSTTLSGITISWKKDNVELGSTLYTVSYNKSDDLNNTQIISNLQINDMDVDSAGKYQCVASNEFGSSNSGRSKIVVASFPTFTKVPENITLESGKTARLNCAARGDPRPQIAWQKDGGNDFPAARERRMHVMPKDDAFYIINAKMFDQGIYTCTAENTVGIITANATLTVNEPPSFVKPMENKEVVTGKSIVLECMASGSPKPILKWLKDNQTIDTTERHFFAADNQLLIIVDAKILDSGNYKCEIKNDLGVENGFMNLTVNPVIVSHIFNFKDMMGVVIITVVCCAVVTSVVWVIIIYQAKKHNFSQNNSTTVFHYECPRITETSFNDHQPTIIETNKFTNSTMISSLPIDNSSSDIILSDGSDETNPLKKSTDENDSAVISFNNINNSNHHQLTQSPSSSISSKPNPISNLRQLPFLNDDENEDDKYCEININGINYTKFTHNLHENKLNKLENLINCSNNINSSSNNNKMSCISIGSLDSVHSLKQSL